MIVAKTQKYHQTCRGTTSAAAAPGSSGGNPNAGANCTAKKPEIPNKMDLKLSVFKLNEDA